MPNTVIVGTQWGDEGKGKIVDLVTERFDIVARSQGGHNAGHTVKIGGRQYILHLIPSGILHSEKTCVIGNGVIIDPAAFLEELEMLEGFDLENRLLVSNRCHLILPYHNALENAEENRLADKKIGTTSRGIGPCYEDKIGRRGIRIGELEDTGEFRKKVFEISAFKNEVLSRVYQAEPVDADAIVSSYLRMGEKILPYVTDTTVFLNHSIAEGKRILFEGAQGTLLDVDHGTYPFVTSSNATAGGASTGTGVGPGVIDGTIGISKAYTTRVGGGPFPTELEDSLGEFVRSRGAEFGASTGRPRRCGWFDATVVRYSCLVNGIDTLVITKLDVLDELEEILVCTGYEYQDSVLQHFPLTIEQLEKVKPVYRALPGWMTDTSGVRRFEDLPENAKSYLDYLSELVNTDISIISVGPGREETIVRSESRHLNRVLSN